MMSVNVVRLRRDHEDLDPEGEGLQVFYDPDVPASVEQAQDLLARTLGRERGPGVCGGTSRASIWHRWKRQLQTA